MTATISESRQRAIDSATDMSTRILAAMPNLVAVRRPDGCAGDAVLYQDDEIGGALCATAEEAQILYHTALSIEATNVLEIGSYVGWTTAHLAASGAHVTCIEPFLEVGGPALQATPSIAAHERFLANIRRSGYADRVTLIVDKSPEVFGRLCAPAGWDLAFVDGWHLDGQPLRDVLALDRTTPPRLIALHDLHVLDVQRAAQWLVSHGWLGAIYETPNWLGMFWRQGTERPRGPFRRLLGIRPGAHSAETVFATTPDLLPLVMKP